MSPQAKTKLIGAIVAAALAIAVYYGLIDQKQADNIRTQADQTLGTGPAGQPQAQSPAAPQSAPSAPPAPSEPPAAPAQPTPAPTRQ